MGVASRSSSIVDVSAAIPIAVMPAERKDDGEQRGLPVDSTVHRLASTARQIIARPNELAEQGVAAQAWGIKLPRI